MMQHPGKDGRPILGESHAMVVLIGQEQGKLSQMAMQLPFLLVHERVDFNKQPIKPWRGPGWVDRVTIDPDLTCSE